MNDAPTIGCVAEDQSEMTMRFIVGAFEFPAAEGDRGIRAKLFDFKI